jgi:hypothetical protein
MLRSLQSNIPNNTLPLAPILALINPKAQTLHRLHNLLSQLIALLTNPAREHQRIDLPAKRNVVRSDEGRDAIDEQVEGEFVVGRGGTGDFGEVRRPRKCFPAGFFVQDLLGARDV